MSVDSGFLEDWEREWMEVVKGDGGGIYEG